MANDLWKLTLLKYKRASDYGQKENKDLIVQAFQDMLNSNIPPGLWKTYLDGIVMFPEMIEALIEYMERNHMTFKGTVYHLRT